MNSKLITRFKKVPGFILYKTAEVFERFKTLNIAERLYSFSQFARYKELDSLLKRYKILQKQKNLWKQNIILEKYLSKHDNLSIKHTLAKNYIQLELYNDVIKLLSDYDDDTSIDRVATVLAKQGNLIEYTEKIEQLFTRQASIHRHNQIFFAYGRTGNTKKLIPLLQKSLVDSAFTNEQKDKFVHATIEGLSRSFYFKKIQLVYNSVSSTYISPYLAICTAMACEATNNTKDALTIYNKSIKTSDEYYWWSTIRSAGIYYNKKDYKKSHLLLSKLFNSYRNIPKGKLPILTLARQAHRYSQKNDYKSAAFTLLNLFPGWSLTLWNDQDNIIFKDYYLHVIDILTGASVDTNNYIASLERYGLRLAEKRLWQTGIIILQQIIDSSTAVEKNPSEAVYVQLARCYTNSGNYQKALSSIHSGCTLYDNSFNLLVEKAQLYTKQANVYQAKKTWDQIFTQFDYKQFAPHIFPSAAEANLMSLDLVTHEKIISLGVSIYGERNRTLAYYIWHSFCTKISNLNTELSITGHGAYAAAYTMKELTNKFTEASKVIELFTYNDEMSHRIKHRAIHSYSLIMIDLWKQTHNDRSLITAYLSDLIKILNLPSSNPVTDSVFNLIRESRNDHTKLLDTAKNIILSTEANNLSYIDWLIVYQLLISNKFLRLGYYAREKSVIHILNSPTDGHLVTHYYLQKKFHAALEISDTVIASSVLDCINLYYPEQSINEELQQLLDVTTPNTVYKPIPNDDIYHKLISNKSVAVVGPAPSTVPQGKDIDNHDVVVRFNYRGKVDDSESVIYGSKTSIAYQNGPNIRTYFSHSIPLYMNELQVYNVEFVLNHYIEKALSNNSARKNRLRIKLFNGSMMAVPTVVFDILAFHPNKITIYGTNFYLSKTQYKKSYTVHTGAKNKYTSEKQGVHRLLELVGHHDLIAQRRFINNLVAAKKISVDSDCQRVLNISDEEYMNRIEGLYSYN